MKSMRDELERGNRTAARATTVATSPIESSGRQPTSLSDAGDEPPAYDHVD